MMGQGFVENLIRNLIESLGFVFERLNWLSILDLAIVTLIFFGLLILLRDTQAVVLLRGVLLAGCSWQPIK